MPRGYKRMMHSIVVGAGRGLGLALVANLLKDGHHVVALHKQRSAGLDGLAKDSGDRLLLLQADVTQETTMREAAERLRAVTSNALPGSATAPVSAASDSAPAAGFDQIIYNAAVHLEHGGPDVLASTIDDVSRTLDVNSVGAVRTVKHLRPLLRDGGQLVLISSEAGSIGQCWRESEYGYCMSKAALNMFARLLEVRELNRKSGVDVRAVHPGWLRTDMGGPNAHDSAEDAARELLETLARPRTTSLYTDRHGEPLPY